MDDSAFLVKSRSDTAADATLCLEGRPGERSASVFLSLVFALSGSADLMFQVCWQRLMSVHYGVGAVSTAIVVSTFMLGLGIGGLLGGRIAERSAKAPLLYVLLEVGIGVFGIASLPLPTVTEFKLS